MAVFAPIKKDAVIRGLLLNSKTTAIPKITKNIFWLIVLFELMRDDKLKISSPARYPAKIKSENPNRKRIKTIITKYCSTFELISLIII